MDFFSSTWLSLPWSPWVPFTADKHTFRQIPKAPGLYRIRPINQDVLMYIGETRRTVHQRVNELRQTLNRSGLMPWNDPHTAARSLRAWQDEKKDSGTNARPVACIETLFHSRSPARILFRRINNFIH